MRNGIEFVLLAAIWGASFLFMRIAAPEFGVFMLVEVRVAFATMILLPILIYRKGFCLWGPHSKKILVVSLTNTTIPYLLFSYAVLYLSAGYTSVINSTSPLWGALIGFALFKAVSTSSMLIGLLIGFVGVVVLTYEKMMLGSMLAVSGVLAGLAATFLYGIAVNYTKQHLQDVDPLTITTESQLQSALMLLPLAFFYWPQQSISAQAWGAALAMGGLCTALALLLYFRLIKNIGSSKAIAVTYLIPIFGVLFGWLLLDEAITPSMILGMMLILTGTALTMEFIKLPRLSR
ncbi:DMT family transporter [Pleionea sp. CnH1-48]|uniref:DMT family transporter n=1 Tax=Pleionea sp. CnH1-48 TaxID=2954494 RepID=UPI0020976F0F|nr:DMT family transporter [Pleionea sp. CnH1-48]MCO7225348.1 DMT family transporter [Pleionea sp. CnH1-48]